MSDAAPDFITRTQAEDLVSSAVAAVRRELRSALTPPSASATPPEPDAPAVTAVALEAYSVLRGDTAPAEFQAAFQTLFGRHSATVLRAIRRLQPRIVETEETSS